MHRDLVASYWLHADASSSNSTAVNPADKCGGMLSMWFAFVYTRLRFLQKLRVVLHVGKSHAANTGGLALATHLLQCMLMLCTVCVAAQGWSFPDSAQTALTPGHSHNASKK